MGVDSQFSFLRASATGRSDTGAVSVSGVQVGDTVIWCLQDSVQQCMTPGVLFEAVVSVADEIQQKEALGESDLTFSFILIRGL